MVDLVLSAGEASGDLHGARLLKHLPYTIGAVAGPRMRLFPLQQIAPMEDLQVMGFTDVLRSLPHLARTFFKVRNAILDLSPKAVVTIDYADFHLQLHASLRKAGYRGKLIHYVAPTVWAWRKGRARKMAKNLDLLLTLLPFEPPHFPGLNARYVGHPLVSDISHYSGAREPLVALFPGSREAPIRRNFPLQLEAARALSRPIAVSYASPSFLPLLQEIAGKTPVEWVSPDKARHLMQRASLALATSGTVTLELALTGTPTVVTYAIRPIDLFLARRLFRIDLPFYALPNLIAQKPLFPELFGPNLTLSRLVHEATRCLQEGVDTSPLRALLGTQDASFEAAAAIRSLL